MHWPFHIHVQNDMDTAIRGLNLLAVWEKLEPGQDDVISLEPGESVEFKCSYPEHHLIRRRFTAAVEAAGGTFPTVWYCPVSDLPVTEE